MYISFQQKYTKMKSVFQVLQNNITPTFAYF